MTKKILVVDDSMTARALFKVCMSRHKSEYTVIEADNKQDALVLAEVEKPFAVVLDYNMPGHNGIEIARAMQEKGIDTHFILMSANTQHSVVSEAQALNFADVLEKPVSSEVVDALLEKLS